VPHGLEQPPHFAIAALDEIDDEVRLPSGGLADLDVFGREALVRSWSLSRRGELRARGRAAPGRRQVEARFEP
jgi:hypothetical protein